MHMKLRQHAEERLKSGTAPATQGWPTGAQALSLLHKLAGAPQSASEALKLLHELQVHQVELDLQHEQAENNRSQLTADLDQATGLFDLAPFGYLVLDRKGHVTAANRLARAWLGAGADDAWVGSAIETLLSPDSRSEMRDLLGLLRTGRGQASTGHRCTVRPKAGGAPAQMVATATPDGCQVLLAFVPVEPAPAH